MLPALIASLFAPAVDLIKKFVSKDEDLTVAMAKMEEVQAKMVATLMEADKRRYDLMTEEVKSSNWLVSSWRPLLSLALGIIVILSSFGLVHPDEHFWNLANGFLGLYIGGRSVEKSAEIVGNIVKGKGK